MNGENLRGIGFLRNKLALKQGRIRTRYRYYEMKFSVRDFGISTPPELACLNSTLGWCGKAVDSLADRMTFREFRNDTFGMNEIYRQNNPDILFDSAILGALISSCSFIYISAGANGDPRMQVIDGGHATGIIDPVTNLLTEGYAVLETKDGRAVTEAYFVPGETQILRRGRPPESFKSSVPYPLLAPIIFRPDAVRPFGHSRISRACMSLVDSAIRTVKRGEISAEFYSFPQKYITGLSPDAETMDTWKAAMSSMLTFTKDEGGDRPTVGQFSQQSMQPHIEQLRMFASLFGGEVGLTLDDLGFPSANPSSAEAIRSTHESLRLTARKAQRTFGSGFLNAGYLAACLRDSYPYRRTILGETQPVWEPIFEPDAAMLSLIGDGAVKINQAIPGFFNADGLRDMTGIRGGQND